ncbi:MAG: hypothetical protein KDA51_08775, partial [Planctomycetales bacterium]|nr:hypothetical protein [Planctomycetales bacterium]
MDLGCRALNWNVAQELALPSWQVKKLVAVTDQRGAKYVEQPLRILRGPGLAICDLLHPLPPEILLANGSESMRTLWTETQSPAALTSLFGGVAPSNETHMELPIAGIGNYQLVMGRMHRQKFLKMLGNEQGRIASDQEWEDGLGVILKGFPDHEIGPAAFQLASWLSEPRDWLRKRLLLEYLIALRPNSDAADWARLSLLKMESSDEMRAWWKTQYEASLAAPMAALAGNFAEPLPVPSDGAIAESPSSLLDNSDSVWKQTPFGSDLPDKGLATRASTEVIAASAASASEITSESEHLQGWLATYETAIGQNPSLRQQPDLCLLGYRVYHRRADSRDDVSSRELDATVSAPQLIGWPQAAAQEKHLLEGQLSRVRWLSTAVHTAVPPILDGNLDESFWQIAQPMQLIALDETDHHSQSTASATLMRWAYDDEYLYVAIECATSPTAAPSPLQRVRGHDSRLDDSDRVEFTLDTDRDYNSAVELAIASDGRTYDRCMGLPE